MGVWVSDGVGVGVLVGVGVGVDVGVGVGIGVGIGVGVGTGVGLVLMGCTTVLPKSATQTQLPALQLRDMPIAAYELLSMIAL